MTTPALTKRQRARIVGELRDSARACDANAAQIAARNLCWTANETEQDSANRREKDRAHMAAKAAGYRAAADELERGGAS